jgi:hypothetical protein
MKIFIKTLCLILIATNISLAQTDGKLDKIVKKNYEVLDVNIKKITEKEVEYSFPNEDLVTSLDLSKVAKITFKSGRTQEFTVNEQAQYSESPEKKSYTFTPVKPNTIAVLLVPFLNTENQRSSAEMAKIAQNDIYNRLMDKTSNIFPLQVQDIRMTNSLLKKSGIDYTVIDEIPIEDLSNILGVDHVLACKVNYTMSVTSGTYVIGDDDFFSTISEEDKTFAYTIYFDMYKKNVKVYSKTRQPFFNMQDSWIDSVNYLLKRSPIYTR